MSTQIIYDYNHLFPHFSRADFMQLKRLLEKKTTCLAPHTAFLTEIESSKLTCSHCLPLPHISCKLSKAEKKISNKISEANLVGLRFNSIMFPLEYVIYSTQGFFTSREAPIFSIFRHVLLSR